MNEKNRNISDTFGKYNNDSVGQVKDVNSSMWEPISTGKPAGKNGANASRSQQTKSAPDRNKTAQKKSSQQTKSKGKVSSREGFISQGKPAQKKKQNKPQSKNQNRSKASSGNSQKPAQKNPPSRTPVGRDMREDSRQQQKHREDLFRAREDYDRQTRSGASHDEISQKRNAKKRRKLLVKNAVTVGAVLIFAVVFIAIYSYSRGALIETVIIDGASIYSSEQICQAGGIEKGRNMLSLRERKVRKQITKKLPYIKDVDMEFELPDTVVLTIRATEDKYVITGAGSWLTLDTDGKVVSDKKQKIKDGMFRVDGFDAQEAYEGETYVPEGVNKERFRLMEKLVTLFDKSGVVTSAVINLQNTEDVTVIVDGKIAIYFGDCDKLDEKVPYASGIVAEVKAAGKTGYIDMRFDLGYFKPGSMTIS